MTAKSKPNDGRLSRVQDFARGAGVTVRALHHYDRLGLLRPGRASSGYRLYGSRELERLEQIVALKYLGIPLKQIQSLLDRDSRKLIAVLKAQRLALEEKRRGLDRAIGAIADAERIIGTGEAADAAILKIIEVIEMQNDAEFFKKYYTDSAWAKLAEKRAAWTPELQAEATKSWTELFAEVQSAMDAGESPVGARAQTLAVRWKALVSGFTGGDPEVSKGLKQVWADRSNWPEHAKEQSTHFANQKVWEFMGKAMAGAK